MRFWGRACTILQEIISLQGVLEQCSTEPDSLLGFGLGISENEREEEMQSIVKAKTAVQ